MSTDTAFRLAMFVAAPLIGLAFSFFVLRGRPERRERFHYMVVGALILVALQYGYHLFIR